MILTETSQAVVTPVSLEEFSAHLRLAHGFPDDGAEDALLDLYLRNAAAAVETRIGRALIRRGFRLQVTGWNRDGHMVLPVGPVAAVASVRFVLADDVIELPAGSWVLEPGTGRQRLTGAAGGALPPVPDGHAVELTFDAGFGVAPADVPGDLRHAVMLLAAHHYEERYGDTGARHGMPLAVQALLETWRPVRI